MKHFKLFFAAVMAVCMAACDGCKKEGELDGYQKCGIAEFKNALDKEVNPQILDYRSAEDFANGHIKGAINIDATSTGTAASWSSDNGPYMQQLTSIFSTSKKIFIYGKSGWNPTGMSLPGRVANTWGKDNTLNLESGYKEEELIAAGYQIEKGN
ncbi:MAG: rhodanese-like domain-containing protein [Paludibacteraceae bacterium]|nr:rhodanese-like domain-containing protein [Paludibacteraceae bacterium]MEE3483798.1 rhodanese-like domain-containing protein [Bacteroidales bacterium]